MPNRHGSNGDFHNGVPDKHAGKKGDHGDNIRSSAELKRAQEAGKKPETKGNSASPRAVDKNEKN